MDHGDNQDAARLGSIDGKIPALPENAGGWAELRAWGAHVGLGGRRLRSLEYAPDNGVRGADAVDRYRGPDLEEVGFGAWGQPDLLTHRRPVSEGRQQGFRGDLARRPARHALRTGPLQPFKLPGANVFPLLPQPKGFARHYA